MCETSVTRQLGAAIHLVKPLIIGAYLPILTTVPSLVLDFFLPRPQVLWKGGVNRALHRAHLGKIDLWTTARPAGMVDETAHLALKPSLLNVCHLGNTLHNDHGEAAVLSVRIQAAAVHLLRVVTPTS